MLSHSIALPNFFLNMDAAYSDGESPSMLTMQQALVLAPMLPTADPLTASAIDGIDMGIDGDDDDAAIETNPSNSSASPPAAKGNVKKPVRDAAVRVTVSGIRVFVITQSCDHFDFHSFS